MAVLSPARKNVPLVGGLKLIHRGKVRDTYELTQEYLLVVTTDGISVFDFVLNALVPDKGWALTVMNHFFLTELEKRGFKTHLIAAGADIDQYLPEYMRGDIDLQSRAMVVRRLEMIPVEFVSRAYLTGSALKEYRKSGTVGGLELPSGMEDGDKLPARLFTPTTKAEEGHDLPLPFSEVVAKYPEATNIYLGAQTATAEIAEGGDLIQADGKGELGIDRSGKIRIGDEIGTCDSSRYWDRSEHEHSRTLSPRRAPPAHDKQRMRIEGERLGIDTLDPSNPDAIAHVHSLEIGEEAISDTQRIYRDMVQRLTGYSIEEYSQNILHIACR
jgi:phosphoribosylaminoimidazole-succinocarboxamide synthase